MTKHASWRGMRTAFVTGSQAYGVPGPNSDVDVVIPADEALGRVLAEHLQLDEVETYKDVVGQIRVGKLNLIFVNKREWHEWFDGTVQLMGECLAGRPANREHAKHVMSAISDRNCKCEHCEGP